MKLKYLFECIDVDNEIIAVPVGEGARDIHGVLKLNQAGKDILDLLKSDTSEEKIVSVLSGKYENDRETLAAYVHKTIDALRENGFLVE